MRHISILAWVLTVPFVAGMAGCGTSQQSDGGESDVDEGFDVCQRDTSQRDNVDPEWELTAAGAAVSGYICPRGDEDYFWFNAPEDGTIVKVHLYNAISLTGVDLCYRIRPEDGHVAAIGSHCDHDGSDAVTDITGTFYLDKAGKYFLEVYDEGGDEQDARASANYLLTIATVKDPDTYEPNNTADQANSIGGAKGFISFIGDQDWFRVEVSAAGQIMSLQLSTSGPAPVDVSYTVYRPDKLTPVNTGSIADGMKGAAQLKDVLQLAESGTYYILVSDAFNDDSDLEVGYTLTATVLANPDSRDRTGAGNNDFRNASAISSGATVSDAYLATRGDQDWYVIQSPGTSDTNPALIEVDLNCQTLPEIDPAVDLIVADPRTPCTKDSDCDLLSWNCGGQLAEYRNAQCPSHECVVASGKCRGAGICLPGGCGIRTLIMRHIVDDQNPARDWAVPGEPRHLRTVAPMFGDTYYILVRDFTSQNADLQHPYTLTVTVRPEPDANEPNSTFQPYATNTSEEETKAWNASFATTINCTPDGGGGATCGPFTGYISFRADQDWYKLEGIPAEAQNPVNQKDTMKDYRLSFSYSYAGNSDMHVTFGWNRPGDFDESFGWDVQGNGSGTFGDNECSYLCGEYHGGRPIYFVVQEYQRLHYDYAHPYQITLHVTPECPAECSWCTPAGGAWACPCTANPNP
ncbi:MAG: hypothetical protein GYA21_09555 [Myxococcales bacterium]|nr:hypothetical protein [Myxococcales bacterium]